MDILEKIAGKVLTGKNKDVKTLCLQALEEGISEEDILKSGLLEGMNEAGKLFKNDDILITHVLLAAGAMNTGIKALQLYHTAHDPDGSGAALPEKKGTAILGTVKGDLHDLGKNLVKIMMEGSGIEVIDLGINVEPEAFIREAIAHDAGIIACSALLTTTMPELAKVVEEAEAAGIRDKVKIMVGGAPVTAEYAKKIGADAYSDNAAEAAEKALEFLK